MQMRNGEVVPINVQCAALDGSLSDALSANLDGLYRFALRLAGNSAEAQDLVQEAAIRAWERRDTDVQDWRAWLFQTLYHAFISSRRRRKRWSEREIEDFDSTDIGMSADPLPAFIAVEDVRRAIMSLPEHLRVVAWLSDAENFRLREIAVVLDCPLGTVASRLARARNALRVQLSVYRSKKLRKS